MKITLVTSLQQDYLVRHIHNLCCPLYLYVVLLFVFLCNTLNKVMFVVK